MDAVIHQLKMNNIICDIIRRDCSKRIKNSTITILKMMIHYAINEVTDEFIDELCYIYQDCLHGSYLGYHEWMSDKMPVDTINASPFWLLRMMQFRDRSEWSAKIKHDYITSFSQIKLAGRSIYPADNPKEIENICKEAQKENEIIWRGIHQEKLLLLYNKVPIDVFNEILAFI